jgi:purine nucleosidase
MSKTSQNHTQIYWKYTEPIRKTQPDHTVNVIIDIIKASPGEISFLVDRCTIMGGAANTIGNVTPAAKYNIWVDSEAAKIVFHSGMPMQMVGWELRCGDAALLPAEMETITSFGTNIGRLCP